MHGITKAEYKLTTCAGIGCSNLAKHPLTVLYLNKVGWFCESCKNSLVMDGLIVEQNSYDLVRLGTFRDGKQND